MFQGTNAYNLVGALLPPTILSGATISVAPKIGTLSKFAIFSMP